ncbi:Flp pilus assembly protein TadG [Shimia aestuarii]|uniref:Flp pilus assembly protein TadG n=2 Tax=Shimia aestuarii TaxID=254406 RepID=A0A1I4M002_9RHOB|nr:Flp pilus assembly protein TadG [Shimia aestuarii]
MRMSKRLFLQGNCATETGQPLGRLQDRTANWMHRFIREEDGVIVGFAIALFLIMLMVGGMSVDLMNTERQRTKLQHTLDRAVLAAADLDQEREPIEVVGDYFVKAGLSEYLNSVTVNEGIGFREVTAKAAASVDTEFMKLVGVDTLAAPAGGTARESIGNVEVSLVLDISGSMGWNSRLTNLKVAAKDFVETMLTTAEAGTVSITIVPYATQVNAGAQILDQLNVSSEHSYSHCVNFVSDQFSKAYFTPNEPLERTAHFDPFTTSEDPIQLPVCPTRAGSQILPFSNDKAEIDAFIDSMSAGGNTSIDLGVKWGSVLLDPSTRDIIDGLITAGSVDANWTGRPTDYTNPNVLKVLVVMSDGENTDQYMLNPSMRTSMSDVWYNAEADVYSVYHSNGTYNYFWPHMNGWYDHPYGAGEMYVCDENYNCAMHPEPGDAVQVTNQDLLARASLKWIASNLFSFSSSAYADWYTSAFSKKESTAKDQYTKNICDITKDQGTLVFAIGFEAPQRGQRVLQDCASSDSHYFDAQGLEISDAFDAIATSIRTLRLTQ